MSFMLKNENNSPYQFSESRHLGGTLCHLFGIIYLPVELTVLSTAQIPAIHPFFSHILGSCPRMGLLKQ